MSIVYDHSCLVTVVRNGSGATRRFSYLPPHGQELAADEELSVVGSLVEAVRSGHGGARAVEDLLRDLDAGNLEIISTPAPIAYDATAAASKVIGIDSGSLYLTDPCWLTSLSEI